MFQTDGISYSHCALSANVKVVRSLPTASPGFCDITTVDGDPATRLEIRNLVEAADEQGAEGENENKPQPCRCGRLLFQKKSKYIQGHESN
jgi:hypothetical protein